MSTDPVYWWERDSLRYEEGELSLRGHRLEDLARQADTPLYVYDPARVTENLNRLSSALNRKGGKRRIYYAMKANRHPELLKQLARSGRCGIDACSPREVLLALECGFRPDQISVTATAVSEQDWEVYRRYGDLTFNADSLSTLRRMAEHGYRAETGIRINPGLGVGYRDNRTVRYAGEQATKFGIYPDRLDEALEICRRGGIRVAGLHLHAGSGFLDDSLDTYRTILQRLADFSRKLGEPRYLNIGGGLGVPLAESDRKLDLEAWSEAVGETVGSTGLEICTEPGDYLVKDAGVLICRVVETEEKGGTHFTYVDAGFNVHPEPAYYGLPLHPVPLREGPRPGGPGTGHRTTLAGNINEALDLFGRDLPLQVEAGEYLALLNAGAYGHAMSSNHCMRGEIRERVL